MSLIEKGLFETIDKVAVAIQRIKEFCPKEGYYLAFSGGKDSQCIYHLALDAQVPFEAHMNLTSVDPPELIRFIRANYKEVIIDKPPITMWRLIEKKACPPTRLMRYCCDNLKEVHGKGRTVLTGIRWAESRRRKVRKVVEQCYKRKSTFYVNPIIDWTDDDVWEFIRGRGLKYCELYDQGWQRIGCIGCPMAFSFRHRELELYPKYKENYIRAFSRMLKEMDRRGLKHRWATGQDVYDWWMSAMEPIDEDQMPLDFET